MILSTVAGRVVGGPAGISGAAGLVVVLAGRVAGSAIAIPAASAAAVKIVKDFINIRFSF
jgi:hypothetical protein